MNARDTIFALSSGHLPSGVAVIRVSGPQAPDILESMTGTVPRARTATLATIRGRNNHILDQGLVFYFPEPHSFTGEPCAEFQVHGGKAVVDAVLHDLSGYPDLRPAEPGEFTRRAFLNGKVDLGEAEALGDLVAAETEAQRRFALDGASGSQSKLYAGWRDRLIHARAMIEAELDFADEADIPGAVSEAVWGDMATLQDDIELHLAGFRQAEIIRDGFRVVILGAPNVGKSSLINTLAKRDVAIVSDEPGTTRDLVEVALDLEGIKVIVTDTAGLREGAGTVEAIGIERALSRASQAHLVLHLSERSSVAPDVGLPDLDPAVPVIAISTKADLHNGAEGSGFTISSRTGFGLNALLDAISERARMAADYSSNILPARTRHVALLREAAHALGSATQPSGLPLELRAEELRVASDALGRISGRVDVEDLLDTVFSSFCIGK